MEKFFKPVHSPTGPDEIKQRRNHHHHHNHHQDPQTPRYTMLDDTDRNTDDSQGHHRHRHHGPFIRNGPHPDAQRHHQFHQSEEDEILYDHDTPVILSRASSSSLSSSSSSASFSSWYTEGSANDPFTLRHAAQPQHSLSCSNIADVRRAFREDESSEPIVYATVKHGSACDKLQGRPQKRGNRGFSALDRGHSRSDEGLLKGMESDLGGEQSRAAPYGSLYKTASLSRSLTFSEEDIVLGVSRGPKRAVSSSQLPSKGILKNKEPHNDIRKAKSMEVLSPRVSKGQDPKGQKGKGVTQVEMEQARANFVQGKMQFSAFLDEITKQVISPSALSILGVNNNKKTAKTPTPAQTPGPVKPELPPKKHRVTSGSDRQHSSSRRSSDTSNPDKLTSYAAKNHHGSPPPHQHRPRSVHSTRHESSRKEKRPSPAGGSVSRDRYGRCGPHLTDGTSTSPEPSQHKPRRHHKQQQQQPGASAHTQNIPQQQPQSQQAHRGLPTSPLSSAQGVGSESSSTKSDSPRARDTGSTANSLSSEQSGQHQAPHLGHNKQSRDVLCDADHFQALQEENADLHQNLLQTVVCIESLEVELQRTRDELSHVKEKYKSLLETHTGTKQANNLLGEHLHIASESLTSERKYLLNRVSQLSAELEDAHRTMAALENINVPCLIKELLEKHFNSAEAIQKLLATSAPIIHSADSQPHAPKMEEAPRDWMTKPQACPQRVTAFIPFKQEAQTTGAVDESRHSPPFSVADISNAIYNKMAASYATRPQPIYPQSQKQPNHTDTLPKLQQACVGGDNWGGKGGAEVTLVEQDVVDVTSVSAQQILDDFMQQLQSHAEAGGGKEQQQQGGREWVGGAEQVGKVDE